MGGTAPGKVGDPELYKKQAEETVGSREQAVSSAPPQCSSMTASAFDCAPDLTSLNDQL